MIDKLYYIMIGVVIATLLWEIQEDYFKNK